MTFTTRSRQGIGFDRRVVVRLFKHGREQVFRGLFLLVVILAVPIACQIRHGLGLGVGERDSFCFLGICRFSVGWSRRQKISGLVLWASNVVNEAFEESGIVCDKQNVLVSACRL